MYVEHRIYQVTTTADMFLKLVNLPHKLFCQSCIFPRAFEISTKGVYFHIQRSFRFEGKQCSTLFNVESREMGPFFWFPVVPRSFKYPAILPSLQYMNDAHTSSKLSKAFQCTIASTLAQNQRNNQMLFVLQSCQIRVLADVNTIIEFKCLPFSFQSRCFVPITTCIVG